MFRISFDYFSTAPPKTAHDEIGILGTEVTVEVRVMSRLLGPMRTSDAITVFVNKLANVCKQNP